MLGCMPALGSRGGAAASTTTSQTARSSAAASRSSKPGSNLGSDERAGRADPRLPLTATGHSVWYEWEATSHVASSPSTPAAASFQSGPRHLHRQRGQCAHPGGGRLRPTSGARNAHSTTKRSPSKPPAAAIYEILVDGVALLSFGRGRPRAVQPAKSLQTPVPGQRRLRRRRRFLARPETGSAPRFYTAHAEGFNWNATKEPGEPAHKGNPGGASVWYSWEAPEFVRPTSSPKPAAASKKACSPSTPGARVTAL